jgi:hypothetical protein
MTGPRDHTKWTVKEQPITRMADSIVWGKQWKAKDRSSPSGTHLARQAYRSLLYTADEHKYVQDQQQVVAPHRQRTHSPSL